mmetsp:Transcript_4734/g.14287  ORF Transcript_4734/g.14287 Transcript_4734/m.14287 type:complete len:239 (+) Transcript_4734:262-978(+)
MFIVPPQLVSSFAMIFFHLIGLRPAADISSSRPRFFPEVSLISLASRGTLSLLLYLSFSLRSSSPLASSSVLSVLFSFSLSFSLSLSFSFRFFFLSFFSPSPTGSEAPFPLPLPPLSVSLSCVLVAAEGVDSASGALLGAAVALSEASLSATGGVSVDASSIKPHNFSAMPSRSALRLSEFLAKLTNLAFFRGKLSYCISFSTYDLRPACLGSADSSRVITLSIQLCCFLSPFFSFST